MSELNKIGNQSQKILNKENLIFEHKDEKSGIESIFCFKDGDIIVFKNTFSVLYDGKTFEEKIKIKDLGALCAFCYISEDEFILLKQSYLALYRFSNSRKALEKIAIIHENVLEENKKLFVLSNNDLLNITQISLEPQRSRIFRRVEDNHEFLMYDLLPDNLLEDIVDIEYVINLEDDEFLTFKRVLYPEEILLKVYSNESYLIKRFNRIKCILGSKRMIYYSNLPIFKMKKKILLPGVCFLNIIDVITLELETTIKISEEIKDIQIFGDNCMALFECYRDYIENKRIFDFYLSKVLIDFESNYMIKKERMKINDEAGIYKTLFKVFNYKEKGLATITDQNYLKIYKNFA
jgi:hypothetical protein